MVRQTFVENTGNLKTATLKLATGESFYLQDSDQGLQMEDIRGFNFDWQNVCLFDAESGGKLSEGTLSLEGRKLYAI